MKTITETDLLPCGGQATWGMFCDPDVERFAIGEPWVNDGWKVATSGRIVVGFPTTEHDTDDGVKRPDKSVHALLARCDDLQELTWPIVGLCAACRGSGVYPDTVEFDDWTDCECSMERVKVGAVKVAHRYVWIIGQLPGLRFEVDASDVSSPRVDFTCSQGGRGSVMGMVDRE